MVTGLNDDRPVALTTIAMKCLERFVMAHINSINSLDPLQFADRPNRSVDDAISLTLHTALEHLDRRDTYARMSIIDLEPRPGHPHLQLDYGLPDRQASSGDDWYLIHSGPQHRSATRLLPQPTAVLSFHT